MFNRPRNDKKTEGTISNSLGTGFVSWKVSYKEPCYMLSHVICNSVGQTYAVFTTGNTSPVNPLPSNTDYRSPSEHPLETSRI